MALFATVEDLATYLRTDFSAADTATATQALEGASEIIRGYLGAVVDLVVDDEIVLLGTGTNMVQLPEIPVVTVTEVKEYGAVLASTYYRWTTGGLLYRRWGCWPRWTADNPDIEVKYTHGYATIPADIKEVALHLAGQVLSGATSGVQSETVGAYSVTYESGGTDSGLMPEDLAVLNRYRMLRVG